MTTGSNATTNIETDPIKLAELLEVNTYAIYSRTKNFGPEAIELAKAEVKELNKTNPSSVKEAIKKEIDGLVERYKGYKKDAEKDIAMNDRIKAPKLKFAAIQASKDRKDPTAQEKADGCMNGIAKLVDFGTQLGHNNLKSYVKDLGVQLSQKISA